MIPIIAVPGTWGVLDPWWRLQSPWWQMLEREGFAPADQQCAWSMGLVVIRHRRDDWERGAEVLAASLEAMPAGVPRVVVAHSHGGQIALLAAAGGHRIDRLLTLGTPPRAEMADAIDAARPLIGRWHHVCALRWDVWGWAGQLAGGAAFYARRTFAQADQNIRMPGIDHVKLLNDPAFFGRWRDFGLIDFLRGQQSQDVYKGSIQ